MNSKQEFRQITPEIPAGSRKLLIALFLSELLRFSVCFACAFLYVNACSPWVLLGAGAQIWESVINLSFQDMFLLEREQQMLIFLLKWLIWVFSNQREISLGRHNKDSHFESQEKGGCTGEADNLSLWLLACRPASLGGNSGMPGEFWNITVLLAPLAGLLHTQGNYYSQSTFLSLLSHTGIPATSSLMEICSLHIYGAFFLPLVTWVEIFRSFLPREQTSITAGLSGTKLIRAGSQGSVY